MSHEKEITVRSFPLLTVKLKNLKKILSDAQLEGDQEYIELILKWIHNTESSIALGEKYDVPF